MMNMRTTRSAAAAAAIAATGLLLAGCSGGGGPTESTQAPEANAIDSVDPCAILSADEIQSFGATPEGKPTDQSSGLAGCDFKGDEFNFGVLKSADSGQAYWEGQRSQFDEFNPNEVGSHAGFSGIALSGKGQGICTQGMYVGKGSVVVDITYKSNTMQGKDPCAQVLKIAQVVEKKLPK